MEVKNQAPFDKVGSNVVSQHQAKCMKKVLPVILIKRKSTIIEVISSLFVLLFVYTALSKLTDYNFFVAQLYTHPGINKYAATIAWLIPTLELCAATLLSFQRTRLTGLYSSLLLMTGFTIYLLYMLRFGDNLPCSCGGVIKYMTWKQHVGFNLFFILIAILAIKLMKINKSENNISSPKTSAYETT
jgi:hypothetical protein